MWIRQLYMSLLVHLKQLGIEHERLEMTERIKIIHTTSLLKSTGIISTLQDLGLFDISWKIPDTVGWKLKKMNIAKWHHKNSVKECTPSIDWEKEREILNHIINEFKLAQKNKIRYDWAGKVIYKQSSILVSPLLLYRNLCHLLDVTSSSIFFVLWSIYLSSFLVHFKNGPELSFKGDFLTVYFFDEISFAKLCFEEFFCSSDLIFSYFLV